MHCPPFGHQWCQTEECFHLLYPMAVADPLLGEHQALISSPLISDLSVSPAEGWQVLYN